MSKFKDFSNSKAGRAAIQAKRQQRRVRIFIHSIEPKSKKMPQAERSALQTAIAAHLTTFKRKGFTGDIALKLDLQTTDKNPPQAHTIAKNLLDLFSVKRADVVWPNKYLLYKDDKQIQVLSVSCRHGYKKPSIYVEATPLSMTLEDLKVAAKASREDEMSLDAMYREDMATDWIADYKKLVSDEEVSRKQYGGLYEPFLKFARMNAQEALLNKTGIKLPVLNWLYEDPPVHVVGFSANDWANLISETPMRLQFGELPITSGSAAAFKERVSAEIKAFKERWSWLIDPLEVAVALEVIVRPSPDTPSGVLHDLDNIVRDYLIPGIVPGFGTVSDPIWLVDWDSIKEADPTPSDKAWSAFRSGPRPPAGTKAGVTRYEVWRLPAVVGQPGILSVALISDNEGKGDILDQIQALVEKSVNRDEDRRWRY
ncbi:hypothetical protein IFR08_17530 [Pseudomonas fluorescens]|uniref:hypothetical protein n=1 Tax=Pseudomonas fluorescens TaxID=294 RepID=UPI00177DD5F7|nr:hypothetical protein [Pseudomonas fluorescens]MBD8100425.1 hypothetical protein [Pseudomonas fluorescens]MBD8775535.1 hypothetical protein [Pseudomonas fluorescens]MBD8782067.1 hypothetical protein [Pseudomonas fluorescens]MBD8794721.1 hypothetical protein [Pseudomonas fluorescens]